MKLSRLSKWLVLFITLCTATGLSVAWLVSAATGDLDPTFGSGGKVFTDFNGQNDQTKDILVQPDGKIVVAGFETLYSPSLTYNFALLRLTITGTLDTSFSGDGLVTTTLAGGVSQSKGLTLQPDGKIILAGMASNGSTIREFALVRYTADGELDPTFGSNGAARTDISSGSDMANGVALQPDGKILTVGTANYGINSDAALTRHTITGTLDTSFGTNGIVTTTWGDQDAAYSVVVQSDGKIVIAGTRYVNHTPDIVLARYTITGTLDTSFGTGGVAISQFDATSQELVYAMTLQPDGKILTSGYIYYQVGSDFVMKALVVRHNPNGSLDSTFGNGGFALIDIVNGEADDLALQKDGKIVAVGYTSAGTYDDTALARLLPDGSPDPSFGTNGIIIISLVERNEYAIGVAIQPDQKILIAANGADSGTGTKDDFIVARFENSVKIVYLPLIVR